MRLAPAIALSAVLATGCISKFTEKTAFKSTSRIMLRAQPSMQMESDYELARLAIPASLKTVEGFYVAGPPEEGKNNLRRILIEGYCQYGTGFVEDDWEVAKFRKDLAAIETHNTRSTHVFTRCLNYALESLGDRWKAEIFETPEQIAKLIKETPRSKRYELMFAAAALGSLINHNLTRVEMIAHLPTVQQMLERVVEMDAQGLPVDPEGSYYAGQINKAHAALPHTALGMIHSARAASMGGDAAKARASFEKALELTDNKFLLARTLMAYRIGLMTNDRAFFHEQLKQVIETSPSVWPEQRLANEVAHRKARRYLSQEQEIFP